MQWYVQDGCWQAEASWHSTGTLPASHPLSDTHVLALRPPPAHASLIYAITTFDGRTICGEVTQQVSVVRKLLSRVQELRFRAENPKAPSDLFGEPAPSKAELEAIKLEAESFLCGSSGRQTPDNDGGDSMGLLSAVGRSTTSGSRNDSPGESTPTQGAATPEKRATPDKRGTTPEKKDGGDTKRGSTPDKRGGGTPVVVPLVEGILMADVALLTRLEALLCLEGGLDVCDVTLAGWLAGCLHG